MIVTGSILSILVVHATAVVRNQLPLLVSIGLQSQIADGRLYVSITRQKIESYRDLNVFSPFISCNFCCYCFITDDDFKVGLLPMSVNLDNLVTRINRFRHESIIFLKRFEWHKTKFLIASGQLCFNVIRINIFWRYECLLCLGIN